MFNIFLRYILIRKEVDDENVLSLNEDEYDDCKDLDEYYDTSNKNKTGIDFFFSLLKI